MDSQPLWSETPLLRSSFISNLLDCNAYLKLENVHPSYSFKFRGISWFIQKVIEEKGKDIHLVIASGGNAGFAAAATAQMVGVRCSVYLPEWAEKRTLQFLAQLGAEVILAGKHYEGARTAAQEAAQADEQTVFVPAYESKTIWDGHSSMITEIHRQLDSKPDAVFCSVGGAGLLGGIIQGLEAVGWDDVPVIALETIGSNCFHYSMGLNKENMALTLPDYVEEVKPDDSTLKVAHFNELRSKASGSLGALEPTAPVVKMALTRTGDVRCVSVPDEMSMKAAVTFADDHKTLVELACSTTLVPAYYPPLFHKLLQSTRQEKLNVVFIVCGGFKITLSEMASYQQILDAEEAKGGDFSCIIDGENVVVPK